MRKKVLSLVLCVAMMASMLTIPAVAADPVTTAAPAATFTDTANHWGAASIDRWTQYGIINGEGNGKFNPDGNLTRGALATVLTNLLGLTKKAENTYSDLKADAWCADAVLKCTAAGIMKGDGVKANPDANITRQEAMVMLGRALGIQPAKTADLTAFTDADKVATWAAGYVTALTKAGIVGGVGDSLVAPLNNMNRASVMKILDKAISDYVNEAGTYDKIVGTGIVLVSAPSVVLKNNKIAGSLLIAEGVGDGEFTLDGTDVAGTTTVRGGGVHSFVVRGGSKLGDVTIARVDGAVRIVTSDGSTIETTYIDDGKDDVIMEGSFGNVSVAGEVPVTLKGADVKTVTATGKNADITVDKDSKVVTVATAQENTKITVAGTVTNVAATAEATGVSLNVSKGGTATSVTTAAPGSVIKNDGNLGSLAIAKGADTVFAKGENATKTNITAADKTDLGVTTIAAQEAKEAVAKAAADQLAAEQLAAAAKTDAEKAAAQAAADKAAADKAAADKAQADSKKDEDKVKEETKVEEKPVTPPVVDEGGKIDPPKPVEPDKPTPPPYHDPYTHVSTAEGLTAALAGTATMIQIDGTLGSTTEYTAYHVARPVTINGGSVYGSFIITVPEVTVQNMTFYTQGGSGPLKNCIDAFTNAVTITGCTFNLSARTDGLGTTYLGNGIVVWPYGDAAVAVNISGNTFNKLKSVVANWSSSAIQVVEQLAVNGFSAYGIQDGTTMKEITLPNEDAIATDNTYNDCDIAYVHTNWSTTGSDYKIYEYTYAETATQLADGLTYAVASGATVKLGKDITLDTQLTLDRTITLDGGNHTITSTNTSAVAGEAAGILIAAKGVTIKNLKVSGPNKTAAGWDDGEYGIKIYNTTGVTLTDVTVTSANAGIQVNSSAVTMTGTIDVSGNEFGGIEVCKSATVGVGEPSLNITGATLTNTTESSATNPTIWIDDYNCGENMHQGKLDEAVVTGFDAVTGSYKSVHTEYKHQLWLLTKQDDVTIPDAATTEANILKAQDFAWGATYWNVGFKMDACANAAYYDTIKWVQISLYKDGALLATRTADAARISAMAVSDEQYGGVNGEYSASFVARDATEGNPWWVSSAFDINEVPTKAVIRVLIGETLYEAVNTNPTGYPVAP